MYKFFHRFFFISLLFLGACKKDNDYVSNGTATLNVINGIIKKDVLVKMNGMYNNSGANSADGAQKYVSFLANNFYYAEAKNTSIDFLNRTDSVNLVSKSLDLKKGGIYTVALAGIYPNAEAVVIDDSNIPLVNQSVMPSDADSIINIRFINLCPDVQPVNIRLQGSATDEVSGLAYKSYTAFKAYPGKAVIFGSFGYSKLNFEVVVDGSVIATYTQFVYSPVSRFKNFALVLTGMRTPGPGQPALEVTPMYYFQ